MASSRPELTVSEPTDLERADVLRLVAHDIKNPLTAVRVLAEMLLEDAPPSLRADLADVVEAVDLAAATTDALADLGRLEAGDEPTWVPDVVDLGAVVREVAERAAFVGIVTLGPCAGFVRADEAALERVITAVLLNGRRMLGPDERLRLDVRGDRVEVFHPRVHFDEAARAALLDLYGGPRLKTRRIRAAALGLGYARHVLQALGGTVELEARPDGLLVRLGLPGCPDPSLGR